RSPAARAPTPGRLVGPAVARLKAKEFAVTSVADPGIRGSGEREALGGWRDGLRAVGGTRRGVDDSAPGPPRLPGRRGGGSRLRPPPWIGGAGGGARAGPRANNDGQRPMTVPAGPPWMT